MTDMTSATQPVLAIENLTTSFRTSEGWRAVIRNINLQVGAGETVAIVGESGSGKSVTALSTMRLLPVGKARCDGRILLAGKDLLKVSEAEMRRVRGGSIGMIFQEPMTSLNPVFTIGNQIAEALVLHQNLSWQAAEAEAVRLMERVRIPAAKTRLNEYPHKFSGGMRQRVMIAMALACRPQLLIADEPTTALDVTIQAEILHLVRELQREENMAVLFITHDMGVVAEIADRTVVMFRGEMIETGPTREIFAAPKAVYTKSLLASIPRLGTMGNAVAPRRFPQVDPATGEASDGREMRSVSGTVAPILKVDDLSVRFDLPNGRIHAVEGVSFDLRPGETLSLVGESGCGKSTTGRAIIRLINPTAGSVMIDGRDVTEANTRELRAMRRTSQMIFQDPFASLNPRITIGSAIAEPMLAHGVIGRREVKGRVSELLEQVGLSAKMADRHPHEFSGGQRQRISIARALALDPKFIIADEAVSALDVSVKAQVSNLLLELQEERQLAYLFISHDMAVVERVSHRVAVMYLGEIVEIGPRAAIFDNPQHPYTRRLISAVPIPDPSRRGQLAPQPSDEIKSAVRPLDYQPPKRIYREVSPGHFVQEA
ncbi:MULTISPECIES: ABC transporter ATP-binding protein [unclassified Rhizobium]|uniref:ABC transporter ATP-binding protein n=1 Tax=unclassified Rhizobium TaxID=2613769 RepID=UPI000DE0DB5B|nr:MULTISPECIES: ABC transporter ATP-binding protein [unclassified Rhizobium]MBB3287053.1 peptide/nickel transport system ATP-binding protein [Rhizobium sp. BK252]MBB3401793.1 peptide/nickel transport system ATP-binding protein [Rhizobium sp. BK289]MBB3414263.1 peptide/nickel transport system ATP-binding protein [Rhizobium sp. BK284]MBB3482150.1 peptide/nickel transport system ATP-binding protein [Rhizobium sp. BK347]